MQREHAYGFGTSVGGPFDEVVARVKAALGAEGFGVLTEIDVSATMRQKLGVDFPPYIILGACNPPLANRALETDREIGLLLPCNVVVYDAGPGEVAVSVMDPEAALGLAGDERIAPLAAEVKERMRRVVASLRS